jgi:glycosyltransferase involved in cell wall biosynthesis
MSTNFHWYTSIFWAKLILYLLLNIQPFFTTEVIHYIQIVHSFKNMIYFSRTLIFWNVIRICNTLFFIFSIWVLFLIVKSFL